MAAVELKDGVSEQYIQAEGSSTGYRWRHGDSFMYGCPIHTVQSLGGLISRIPGLLHGFFSISVFF